MGLRDLFSKRYKTASLHEDSPDAKATCEQLRKKCSHLEAQCEIAQAEASIERHFRSESQLQAECLSELFRESLSSAPVDVEWLYHRAAPYLDPDGFRLYAAACRMTGFVLYDTYPYEDACGLFEMADGHFLLQYLEAAYFDAVRWEIVKGTTYERAVLGDVDHTTPEYKKFRERICAGALEQMGLKKVLQPKGKSDKEVKYER